MLQLNAENCVIEADFLGIKDDAQYRAKNSVIRGKIVGIGRRAQYWGENCVIEGEDFLTIDGKVQNEAENSVIRGNKIVIEGSAQSEAENCVIDGKLVKIRFPAQYCAKNCVIEGERLRIEGDAQRGAENSVIRGKEIIIKSMKWIFSPSVAQKTAKNCVIEGEIVEADGVQYDAENCYILVEKELRCKEIMSGKGGAIVAKTIRTKPPLDPQQTIITTSDLPGATKCEEEDFEKILNFFRQRKPEALKLFRIESDKIDYKTLLKEIEDLEKRFREVNEVLKQLLKLGGIDIHELKTNEEKYKFLSSIKDEEKMIRYHLDFLEKEGLADDYLLFEKKYVISPEGVIETGEEERKVNEVIYRQGMDIIRKIKRGEIQLNPRTPEIERLNAELKKVKERLKRTKGREGRDDLKEIRSKIEELKKEESERIRSSLKDEYTPEELKEELNQLSQHYLSGKPGEIARYISDSIKIEEKSVSNTMKISVWNKTVENIPTYKEYRCCAFPGYSSSTTSIIKYMKEPRVQLLKVDLGDKNAMVITFADGKTLIVDSVESRYHIFARKNVSEALIKAIKDYAKSSGFERVIVSTSGGNSAHREFLKHVKGERVTYKASLPDCYLEFEGSGIEI